ncbi:MAG: hypothetical protein QW292_12490 [Candidatus Parvarchaeota archaeon]
MFYYYPKLKITVYITWRYIKKEEKYKIEYKLSKKSEDGISTIRGADEYDRDEWKDKRNVLIPILEDGNIASSESINRWPESMDLAKHLFVLAGKDASAEIANTINEMWRKEIEGSAPASTEIFLDTVKVVSYGPASGLDVSIGSENRKFRLHDEDFISPKNFKIWYASEFGKVPEISMEEWKSMVEGWMSIAERRTSMDDDLVPSIWEDFMETLRMNTIYDEFSEELLDNLRTSNVSEFVLQGNSLYVYNRIYEHLRTKFDLKARKLREYFLPFLLESSTRNVHKGQWQCRFWVLDWTKLKERFPEIKEFEAKVVHVEKKEEEYDVVCKICKKGIMLDPTKPSLKDDFISEHIALHGLEEPDTAEEYAAFLKKNFGFYDPDIHKRYTDSSKFDEKHDEISIYFHSHFKEIISNYVHSNISDGIELADEEYSIHLEKPLDAYNIPDALVICKLRWRHNGFLVPRLRSEYYGYNTAALILGCSDQTCDKSEVVMKFDDGKITLDQAIEKWKNKGAEEGEIIDPYKRIWKKDKDVYCYKELRVIAVEIKSYIKSMGETMRQLQSYSLAARKYLHNIEVPHAVRLSSYVVLMTPDSRFNDIFEEQGFHVFPYEDEAEDELGPQDSVCPECHSKLSEDGNCEVCGWRSKNEF